MIMKEDEKTCYREKGAIIGNASIRIDEDGIRVPQEGDIIVKNNVWIGANSTIARGDDYEHPTYLGENVTVGPLVLIGHGCRIEKDSILHGGCKLAGYVVVKEGARIGMGACIRNRVTIGERAVVGIGAVVTKDVPAGEVWVGNPAKFLKKVE